MNKLEFEVEKDGKTLTLYAILPSIDIEQKAQIQYAAVFAELVNSKLLLRAKLKDAMRDQNLWDEDKQKELDAIDTRIMENLSILPDSNGKVSKKGLKMSELRKAAIQIKIDRIRRMNLLKEISKLDENTVEGLAEDARFNYLISQCIVDESKKPYFQSYEDYKARAKDFDTRVCANKFFELVYGDPVEAEKEFPENSFLLKNKMVNDDLALIGKDGTRVDVEGKPLEQEKKASDEDKNEFEVENDWV